MPRLPIVLTSLLSLALLAPSAAAASQRHLDGWNNVTWGMSEEDVQKALGTTKTTVRRYATPGAGTPYSVMDVERYEIEGIPFSGQFSFGDRAPGLSRMTFSHRSSDAWNCYSRISKSLEIQYGQSGPEETTENLISKTIGKRWAMENGNVRMSYASLRDAPEGSCNLTVEGR